MADPPKQLSDAYAKIERADEHVRYLAVETAGFVQARLYTLIRKPQPYGRPDFFQIKWRPEAPRRLVRIGVISGEVVHHLRSALNHLVYMLVTTTPGGAITKSTEFPVILTSNEYVARAPGEIKGVTGAAAARIELAQPYHRSGADDPLWVVHDLDITDKHHVLVVVAARGVHELPSYVNRHGHTITGNVSHALNDGTYFPADVDPTGKMDVDTNLPIQIAFPKFGLREHEPVVPSLTQLCEAVRLTVDQFWQFFP